MPDSRWLYVGLICLVVLERLIELVITERNARRLRSRGGFEVGNADFLPMALLHTGLLIAAPLEVFRCHRPLVPVLGVAMLLLLAGTMALRYWAIASLGDRWTTRVFVVPGEPPVAGGPYRWLRHPSYLAVIVEVAALPLIHGAWWTALAFSIGNALVLRTRIRVEEEALKTHSDYQGVLGDRPRIVPGGRAGRHAGYALAAAVTLVSGLAAYWRVSGLDPPSLYLDDQWVAILVRRASWRELFGLAPPIPLGFIVLERVFSMISLDPEWPLQVLPAAASVALVPLTSLLAWRLTGRRSFAFLAAVLVAVDPTLAHFAVAVKQYATDALVVVLVLLAGLPLLRRWSPRRAAALAAGSLVGLTVSFPSIFASGLLVNLSAFAAARNREDGGRAVKQAVVVAVLFDLCLALFYLGILRHQTGPAMVDYWRAFFLPVTSAGTLRAFLTTHGRVLFDGALPTALGWAALLILPATADLLWHRRSRIVGLFCIGFYVQLFVASALELYPLGTGRTDIFTHGITLALVVYGLHAILRLLPLGRFAGPVVVALASAVLVTNGGGAVYRFANDDAALVRSLEQVVTPEDSVILYPHTMLAVGYYGRWPIAIRAWADFAHGFEVRIERPATLTLSAYRGFEQNPAVLAPDLDRFLAREPHLPPSGGTQRVVFLTGNYAEAGVHGFIHEAIVRAGYRFVRQQIDDRLNLLIYQRRPSTPRI